MAFCGTSVAYSMCVSHGRRTWVVSGRCPVETVPKGILTKDTHTHT